MTKVKYTLKIGCRHFVAVLLLFKSHNDVINNCKNYKILLILILEEILLMVIIPVATKLISKDNVRVRSRFVIKYSIFGVHD